MHALKNLTRDKMTRNDKNVPLESVGEHQPKSRPTIYFVLWTPLNPSRQPSQGPSQHIFLVPSSPLSKILRSKMAINNVLMNFIINTTSYKL